MIQVTRETHEAPGMIQDRIAGAGGSNWLGEPNFRVVWGGSRLGWIGGRWIDRDSHGNAMREIVEVRRVPKYAPPDRWHIERWMPSDLYGTPDEWYAQTMEIEDGARIPGLGPYPSRGEYEHCFTLSGRRGEFIQLTSTADDWIVQAIEWARRQPRTLSKAAISATEDRRVRDWDNFADELLDEPLSQ